MISGKFIILDNLSSVLPNTVLWSVSKSQAIALTLSLLEETNDLWKETYLDASIAMGCSELDNGSIKYLWVHLSTL